MKSKQQEMETDPYIMSTVKRAMNASIQFKFSSLYSSDLNPANGAARF